MHRPGQPLKPFTHLALIGTPGNDQEGLRFRSRGSITTASEAATDLYSDFPRILSVRDVLTLLTQSHCLLADALDMRFTLICSVGDVSSMHARGVLQVIILAYEPMRDFIELSGRRVD